MLCVEEKAIHRRSRRRLSTGAANDKMTIFLMAVTVPHANLFSREQRKSIDHGMDPIARLKRVRETGLSGFAAQIQLCSLTGSYVMATAEHREPYESRGSRTVLGARGGEIPPRDSTKRETPIFELMSAPTSCCRHTRLCSRGALADTCNAAKPSYSITASAATCNVCGT